MTIRVGQTASVRRTFTQSDFDRFAALSGDDNPIHVDTEFAARTRFGRTVAHGMFLYSLVSGVLGTRLPGPGTLQVEQGLMFPTATPAGEELEIRVEVTGSGPGESWFDLATAVIRPDGSPGLQGRTRVGLPSSGPLLVNGSFSPAYPVFEPGSFKGMELGQRAQIQRAFAAIDLAEYSSLSGDSNPVFTDAQYARQRGLDGTLVPGALLGGLFSYLLGTELPGRGTNYLKQKLYFPAPAFVGQVLTASVVVERIRPEKQLVNLRTVCEDEADNVVCFGEALVLVRDVGHDE